jgi:glycine cleavage system H protein
MGVRLYAHHCTYFAQKYYTCLHIPNILASPTYKRLIVKQLKTKHLLLLGQLGCAYLFILLCLQELFVFLRQFFPKSLFSTICMNIPAELRYTKEHEWLKVEQGNIALVGITDHAQKELGDIVYVEVNTVGEDVAQEGVFGSVDAVKVASDLFSPVSGKVLEVNADLSGNPSLVNAEPYSAGWLIRIEMSNPAEVDGLLSADQYRELIGA